MQIIIPKKLNIPIINEIVVICSVHFGTVIIDSFFEYEYASNIT